MKARYFYGAKHRYSTEFCNDVSCIVRFTSKAARDAWVDDDDWSWNGGNWCREAVSRNQARRLFPRAFQDLGQDWYGDGGDCWSREDEWRVGLYA